MNLLISSLLVLGIALASIALVTGIVVTAGLLWWAHLDADGEEVDLGGPEAR